MGDLWADYMSTKKIYECMLDLFNVHGRVCMWEETGHDGENQGPGMYGDCGG